MENNKKSLIEQFNERRSYFSQYIKDNKMSAHVCSGCGYPIINGDICDVCNWEDDGQNDKIADEVRGGPNSTLSLTANRVAIQTKLNNLAKKLDGKINQNPTDILKAIEERRDAFIKLMKSLPWDVIPDQLFLDKLKRIDENLFVALITK